MKNPSAKELDIEKEINSLLGYCKVSGNLYWKISTGRRNNPAGSIHKLKGSALTYKIVTINNKKYFSHRLAWFLFYGEWPEIIDHIDGDGLNNKIENLRSVNNSDNRKNMRVQSRNSIGLCGVDYIKKTNKYRARIFVDNAEINLGMFTGLFDAACVRKSAENRFNFHENHGRNM